MKQFNIFLVYISVTFSVLSQPISTDTTQVELLGKIAIRGGSDIEVDNEGNIYVLQKSQNKIHKYLAQYNYDSVYSVGGIGSRGEGFLGLTEIKSKNRQILYGLDEAQRSIIVLNSNLKPLEDINFTGWENSEDELIPMSFDISEWGDLFLLNATDNKVYKWDIQKKQMLSFGGWDYGEGRLANPNFLKIDRSNNVWVADTSQKTLISYDNFGIYRYKLEFFDRKFVGFKNFVTFAQSIVLFGNKTLTLYTESTGKSVVIALDAFVTLQESNFNIQDIYFQDAKFFVLSHDAVYILMFKQ